MSEIIINSTPQETRIALVENGEVVELFFERKKDRGILGNIYKGKVVRVLPGMESAFVDIGMEKAAFLYVSEVFHPVDDYREMFLGDEDEPIEDFSAKKGSEPRHIEDLLTEGQEILVQVSKEPIGSKGCSVTSLVSLPGRYLVLMPFADHIGVSRRIEDSAERERLRTIAEEIQPRRMGLIARTAAEGVARADITADLNYLLKVWESILKAKNGASAPFLLHEEPDICVRAVRDLLSGDVRRIVADDKETYGKIKDFLDLYLPNPSCTLELYQGFQPVFDYYNIELEIHRAMGKKVWLKSGGYIVIEQTEALVAIDVNTGRFVGKRNLEETILQTNLEAAREIAYQLRLRNIGGIIIIDFIDMEKAENREKVFNALKEHLRKDKAKTNVLKISELGLVEMTRKRTRESLCKTISEECPYCEGTGRIRSRYSICYDILRELKRLHNQSNGNKVLIHVHEDVADILLNEEAQMVDLLQIETGHEIIIRPAKDLHIEQYEIICL
ncbi:MAG: ribonuclease E/G [Deltaproteobacteria bacterium]|nr:ribonuclease E/G [Deltaproteobacteria bacterium]